MKNSLILLLSFVLLLLFFFTFQDTNQITGFAAKQGGKAISGKFIVEQPTLPTGNEKTVILADKTNVNRGGRTSILVIPGQPGGVFSRVKILQNDKLLKTLYICGKGPDKSPDKICFTNKLLPITISKSWRGQITLRFVDVKSGEIPFTLNVK